MQQQIKEESSDAGNFYYSILSHCQQTEQVLFSVALAAPALIMMEFLTGLKFWPVRTTLTFFNLLTAFPFILAIVTTWVKFKF